MSFLRNVNSALVSEHCSLLSRKQEHCSHFCVTLAPCPHAPTGTRARARAQTIEDLKRVARQHLATDGADLSLRSVARELGMVSSAVYRYFDSRDALLTALIIDAYDDLGEAAEPAEAAVRRTDLRGRWLATCHAVRDWSTGPPGRVRAALRHAGARLRRTPGHRRARQPPRGRDDGDPARRLRARAPGAAPPRAAARARPGRPEGVIASPGFEGVPPALLARGMNSWAAVFGLVSFELFGRLTNADHDYDAWFDYQLRLLTHELGL